MAINGSSTWGADREQPSPRARHILRLGSRVALDTLPTLPATYRVRASQSHGKLGQILIQVTSGAAWCRLDAEIGGQVWPPGIVRIDARTLPLTGVQPSTPSPDAVPLFSHMAVEGRDGLYGKLEGVVIATATGAATSLLLRVREQLEDVLGGPDDPLTALLRVAGREIMLAADWIKPMEPSFQSNGHHLELDATAAQIAQGLVLRSDREIEQDVWRILGESRALGPLYQQLRVDVQDGTISIAGPALSPRLRASLEQDIWHVGGVLAVKSRFE